MKQIERYSTPALIAKQEVMRKLNIVQKGSDAAQIKTKNRTPTTLPPPVQHLNGEQKIHKMNRLLTTPPI